MSLNDAINANLPQLRDRGVSREEIREFEASFNNPYPEYELRVETQCLSFQNENPLKPNVDVARYWRSVCIDFWPISSPFFEVRYFKVYRFTHPGLKMIDQATQSWKVCQLYQEIEVDPATDEQICREMR